MPQKAVLFFALNFQVTHRALQDRVPVDQALAAVNQALLVQLHKGGGDHLGHFRVHGEVLVLPRHRVAHAPHLLRDGGAGLFFPFPDFVNEGGAAQVVAGFAFTGELALDHDLRGNAGVVGAGHPQRVFAQHAVVARERVHDGLIKSVAHVQRARHIGRRQLDGKRRLAGVQRRLVHAALLPGRAPVRFQCSGLERFGQGLQSGLLDGRGGVLGKGLGGGLAHGDFEMKNGAGRQAVSMEGRKTMILTKRQPKGLCRRRHE